METVKVYAVVGSTVEVAWITQEGVVVETQVVRREEERAVAPLWKGGPET